jgi:glycosyltransferase involved in cell wall biosynthesis
VATKILSHTQVLTDDVCFLADPNASSLAAAILSALTDDGQRKNRIAAARELYERQYSRTAYERKIAALLELLR